MGEVDPLPEQTGLRGLRQQIEALLLAETIVRTCLLLGHRQVVEQASTTAGNRVVEQARNHLVKQR